MKDDNHNLIVQMQSRIENLLLEKDLIIIAIDGNSGAGKSTLAQKLSQLYDSNIFHMDHFFLTPGLKTPKRLNEIGGNVDYRRFYEEAVNGLKSRQNFKYRIYNCQTCSFDETITVSPKRINIVEGVYSMHPTIIDIYDLKIFLSVDKEEQSRRILERSGPHLHNRFINLWIPLENKYFDNLKIKEQSDLLLENGSDIGK